MCDGVGEVEKVRGPLFRVGTLRGGLPRLTLWVIAFEF
jgi:hypothetical protein